MKNLKKLFLMLGILLGLFACSSLPTEEDSSSSVKSSVQFTMQNIANLANSNILFSTTDEQTPSKVAISYKKSGEGEAETSTTIELQAFGSSYITSNTITLEVGDYYVTKFDVLNSSGNTIFSTPMKNSPTAIASGVTKALEYSFSVESGVSNTETMQVVAVDSTTDPYDFGFTDFTFEVFSYNKFYIVARILDESTGWVHTEAIVTVANSEGATIKTDTISGAENKIIMAKDDSYKITISKNGYISQELSFTADSLETYKSEPLIVNLQKNSNNITDGLVAYYPFNGNANDESGNENNGNVSGATLTSDRFGNENSAYSFDGTDDYILKKFPNNLATGDEDRSMSAWFKSYKNDGIIISYGQYTYKSWQKHNHEYAISAQTIGIEIYGGLTNNDYLINNSINYIDSIWHNIIIVKTDGKSSIYIDGTLIGTTPSHTYDTYNEAIMIGQWVDFNRFFQGDIDDVRIYNRALTEEEVNLIYNSEK